MAPRRSRTIRACFVPPLLLVQYMLNAREDAEDTLDQDRALKRHWHVAKLAAAASHGRRGGAGTMAMIAVNDIIVDEVQYGRKSERASYVWGFFVCACRDACARTETRLRV